LWSTRARCRFKTLILIIRPHLNSQIIQSTTGLWFSVEISTWTPFSSSRLRRPTAPASVGQARPVQEPRCRGASTRGLRQRAVRRRADRASSSLVAPSLLAGRLSAAAPPSLSPPPLLPPAMLSALLPRPPPPWLPSPSPSPTPCSRCGFPPTPHLLTHVWVLTTSGPGPAQVALDLAQGRLAAHPSGASSAPLRPQKAETSLSSAPPDRESRAA